MNNLSPKRKEFLITYPRIRTRKIRTTWCWAYLSAGLLGLIADNLGVHSKSLSLVQLLLIVAESQYWSCYLLTGQDGILYSLLKLLVICEIQGFL